MSKQENGVWKQSDEAENFESLHVIKDLPFQIPVEDIESW